MRSNTMPRADAGSPLARDDASVMWPITLEPRGITLPFQRKSVVSFASMELPAVSFRESSDLLSCTMMTDAAAGRWVACAACCCAAGAANQEPAVAGTIAIAVLVRRPLCPKHNPLAIRVKTTADERPFMSESNPGDEISVLRLVPAFVACIETSVEL